MIDFDVAIVGGGPAGSSTALHLVAFHLPRDGRRDDLVDDVFVTFALEVLVDVHHDRAHCFGAIGEIGAQRVDLRCDQDHHLRHRRRELLACDGRAADPHDLHARLLEGGRHAIGIRSRRTDDHDGRIVLADGRMLQRPVILAISGDSPLESPPRWRCPLFSAKVS